jgi:hypothetical protein
MSKSQKGINSTSGIAPVFGQAYISVYKNWVTLFGAHEAIPEEPLYRYARA